MYRNMFKELEKDLDSKILRTIYLTFNASVNVYNDLIEKEKDLLSGEYFDEIKGRLLGFIIKKAFDPKLLPTNFPFNVQIVNLPFKQKMPKLKRGNTILTISKVMEPNLLPSPSKYKKEYAEGNYCLSNQLEFNLDKNEIIQDKPYYGIIAYKFYEEQLKMLNIIIPDSEFKYIIRNIPIPLVYSMQDENVQEEPIINEENLKKSILNDFNLKIIE